jgi:hypothetical protein
MTDAGKRANSDMIEGFRDGYDLTAPDPSANRSASYRHGFMVGRLDKTPSDWSKYTHHELSRMADKAMEADEPRGL